MALSAWSLFCYIVCVCVCVHFKVFTKCDAGNKNYVASNSSFRSTGRNRPSHWQRQSVQAGQYGRAESWERSGEHEAKDTPPMPAGSRGGAGGREKPPEREWRLGAQRVTSMVQPTRGTMD